MDNIVRAVACNTHEKVTIPCMHCRRITVHVYCGYLEWTVGSNARIASECWYECTVCGRNIRTAVKLESVTDQRHVDQ